jgi:hypothetical protein
MVSVSKSIKRLATCGGLIAQALVSGCGSSESARASDDVPSSAPVETATPVAAPATANASVVDDAAATPVVAAVGNTLCQSGETPLFSCEIGAKRVSVCGGGSSAVYRYGTPGKVELTARGLTYANRGYSGGGESQITAKNNEYTYTVYDRTARTSFGEGGNDPEFASGLVIARGGRVLSSMMCKGESPVQSTAERALPAGSFVEH